MRFQAELPGGNTVREEKIDWAAAKAELIEHEGLWGLIAENISASTPQQLRKGRYQAFPEHELPFFEFAMRKPADAEVARTYAPRRSDLWGRYNSTGTEA